MKDANYNQLKVIAEECVLWDGDRKNIYRTTIKKEADFIQFAFMTAYNTNAPIVTEDRIGESFNNKYSRKSRLYTVYSKGCKSQGLKDGMVITPFEDKKMYCFTVESGMLLLRRNDRVFVTGNSGKDCSKVDRSASI